MKILKIVTKIKPSNTKEMRIASYVENDIGIYNKKGNLIAEKNIRKKEAVIWNDNV